MQRDPCACDTAIKDCLPAASPAAIRLWWVSWSANRELLASARMQADEMDLRCSNGGRIIPAVTPRPGGWYRERVAPLVRNIDRAVLGGALNLLRRIVFTIIAFIELRQPTLPGLSVCRRSRCDCGTHANQVKS